MIDRWNVFWNHYLRLAWHVYCTQESPGSDSLDRLHQIWIPITEESLPDFYHSSIDHYNRLVKQRDIDRWNEQLNKVKECADLIKFYQIVKKSAYHLTFSEPHRFFNEFTDNYIAKTSKISKEVISSLKEISIEYMSWLSKHTEIIDKVHWKAFEGIVREIMSSRSLSVDYTANQRGKSADLIAIDQKGTNFLVECKRYSLTKKVGLGIVNAVPGSAVRNEIENCLLVTSSKFSSDAIQAQSSLGTLNLELLDGLEVANWLKGYKPRTDMGLWIDKGWM